MRLSPILLTTYLSRPLRYLFKEYATNDLKWDPDPMHSKIEIGSINDFTKHPIQQLPRVLVSRGGYQVSHVGLADNLAEGKGIYESKGLSDSIRMLLISGQAQILIQARQEGTAEILTDMVQHFVTWTAPYLCNTEGFKTFAIPLSVSPCTPNREDSEIFEVSIGIPWTREEHFRTNSDALKLKGFRLDLEYLA